ncbi:MAG: leucine-rich repeat domain-containing protein [Oscillospiraceae bacterium]|nr:leucine-rich repeat domain-containing protein [Oscillospiraceae bacterium]
MKTKKTVFALALLMAVMLMTACGSEKTSGTTASVNSNPTSSPAVSSKDTSSKGGNEASASEFEYKIENGGVTLTKYTGKESTLVLPSQIEGKDVKKLGFSFLRSDEEKAVTSVVMSDTITELNAELFSGNPTIKSITFSKGLKEIPKKVCQDTPALENIVLPDGLEVIEHAAFNNCDALKSVVVPDSVKECSVNSFFACDLLETITYKGKTYGKKEFDSFYSAVRSQQ